MPKASINLPDGTLVVVEGSSEEVAKILSLYGASDQQSVTPKPPRKQTARKKLQNAEKSSENIGSENSDSPNLSEIISQIKNCEQAESIEAEVLDKVGQVNRVLLPLFIVHEYFENAFALTSGDVTKITTDLGIPVQQPNASRTLSGTASKYVIGDTVRKKGQAVKYKLSRRGIQYFQGVLNGDNGG